ncbi:MAG: NAD-dependent epimerase/dehydratase family protein [Patescibacteria group bacterium]
MNTNYTSATSLVSSGDNKNTTILVTGAGGFIGGHLVKYLFSQGYEQIRAVDIKSLADWHQITDEAENLELDLKSLDNCRLATSGIDEVYNLASDMGGIGFIENNKALCMLNILINTHLLMASHESGVKRFFYSSSACVYARNKQLNSQNSGLKEIDVYPAMPEDGYGWEKLFSERMCRHFMEDFGLETRVARFHNVYGPYGEYKGGREKAPAAIIRKIVKAKKTGGNEIEIWGDGLQSRTFMYIDDCLKGIDLIMHSDIREPINLGTNELVSIDELVLIVEEIAGIKLKRVHNLDAPQGVRGRSSDNTMIKNLLNWEPRIALLDGMKKTYEWIEQEMR